MSHSTQTLARRLIARGHQVDIVYWDCARGFKHDDITAGRPCRVNIFGLSRHSLASNIVRKLTKILAGRFLHEYFFFYAWLASPILQRFLLSAAYDRIFIQDQHYIPVHRLRLPHTAVVHSNWQCAYLRHRFLIFNTLRRKIYRRLFAGKSLYTVSEGVRENLINCFGVHPENVACIYNPVDFQDLSELASKEPATPLPQSFWLACGRLTAAKRFDRLIRAFAVAQLPDDLVIIGGGSLRRRLEKLAAQLGLKERVHLIGFQSNPMPYYRRARCLLISSDYEGLPTVLLESLACGTPAISTDCPSGPGEILRLVGLQDYLVFKPQDWLAEQGGQWGKEKEEQLIACLAEKMRLFDRKLPAFDFHGLHRFELDRVVDFYLQTFPEKSS